MKLDIPQAVAVLRQGGLIACPTEAVWGLSCDPANEKAVMTLLALKQRSIDKGLIVVAAHLEQLNDWIDLEVLPPPRRQMVLSTWPGPHTWALPASKQAPIWLTGQHQTVAVRVTTHPLLRALCTAWNGPLISTSANRSGHVPVRQHQDIDPAILQQLDGVLEGAVGDLPQPTPITLASTGQVLRF